MFCFSCVLLNQLLILRSPIWCLFAPKITDKLKDEKKTHWQYVCETMFGYLNDELSHSNAVSAFIEIECGLNAPIRFERFNFILTFKIKNYFNYSREIYILIGATNLLFRSLLEFIGQNVQQNSQLEGVNSEPAVSAVLRMHSSWPCCWKSWI